jgi:hypothetical protein
MIGATRDVTRDITVSSMLREGATVPLNGSPSVADDTGLARVGATTAELPRFDKPFTVVPSSCTPPIPGQPGRYEFEYERRGRVAYMEALDLLSGRVSGHLDDTVAIVPSGQLVALVMTQVP